MTVAGVKRERIPDVKEEIVVKEEQPPGEPADSDSTDEYCPSSNLAVSKFAASLLKTTWGYSSFRQWQEVSDHTRSSYHVDSSSLVQAVVHALYGDRRDTLVLMATGDTTPFRC